MNGLKPTMNEGQLEYPYFNTQIFVFLKNISNSHFSLCAQQNFAVLLYWCPMGSIEIKLHC